uniref:SF4 helicase domain-containing protein n=1 Tax=Parastrongyloides trichosuri TaxID=131310 RepID=A0A0N4ZPE1_PARTI
MNCCRSWLLKKKAPLSNTTKRSIALSSIIYNENDTDPLRILDQEHSKNEHDNSSKIDLLLKKFKKKDKTITVQLTPTDIINDLKNFNVPHKKSHYTNFVTTTCHSCWSHYSTFIIPEENLTHCIDCGAEGSYEEYKKLLEVKSNFLKEIIISESPNELLNENDLDPDLYDNISFTKHLEEHYGKEKNVNTFKHNFSEEITDKTKHFIADKIDSLMKNVTKYYEDDMITKIWNESQEIPQSFDHNLNINFKIFNKNLGIDSLSPSLLRDCNIRIHYDDEEQLSIIYPRFIRNIQRPIGLKIIKQTNSDKLIKQLYPQNNRFSGIFCYHKLSLNEKTIILTTNERDALAINQSMNTFNALSLPKGCNMDYSIIPYLESFEKIYLWFPEKQQIYAKNLAIILNISRCYIILEKERPIELLRKGESEQICNIIKRAYEKNITNAFKGLAELREDVKAEIVDNAQKMKGFARWIRFDILNEYLYGLRPSELTVITGGSGYGKTTFISEYSIDLFTQGVRTMICSFEMSEEKIMKWMLVQYASVPLYRKEHHSLVEVWLDRFEKRQPNIMFLKTNTLRNKNINDIFNILKENIIQCGIQHVVIDNLQFLIGISTLNNDSSSSLERFNLQDRFIGLLRNLATDCGVHITLVVHPRKTPSDISLELQDVGGSGKITQEADNVLAIIRKKDEKDEKKSKKYLVILKNRYGGRRTNVQQIEMIYQAPTFTHILIDHSKEDDSKIE